MHGGFAFSIKMKS